jgi:hypothetical protein
VQNWGKHLKYDPLPSLLSSDNKAIEISAKYDLLDDRSESIETLLELKPVGKILRKQNLSGSWKYLGGKKDVRSQENYDQIETYRQLGFLIEKYKLSNRHSGVKKAIDFIYKFQTGEGDFRGIYGNQYSPNYSAGIMELMIKAGYNTDKRIQKGLDWLLSVRQDDGGWAIPARTVGMKLGNFNYNSQTIQPDVTKPFSHMVTGVVLRAFAAHPVYRGKEDVKLAGELLASRFFKPDRYTDRRDKSFWTKFSYPFWFTDLLSALDSLSIIGFNANEPRIKQALDWFRDMQKNNGLWELKLLKVKDKDLNLWIALTICKIFKRFYE